MTSHQDPKHTQVMGLIWERRNHLCLPMPPQASAPNMRRETLGCQGGHFILLLISVLGRPLKSIWDRGLVHSIILLRRKPQIIKLPCWKSPRCMPCGRQTRLCQRRQYSQLSLQCWYTLAFTRLGTRQTSPLEFKQTTYIFKCSGQQGAFSVTGRHEQNASGSGRVTRTGQMLRCARRMVFATITSILSLSLP